MSCHHGFSASVPLRGRVGGTEEAYGEQTEWLERGDARTSYHERNFGYRYNVQVHLNCPATRLPSACAAQVKSIVCTSSAHGRVPYVWKYWKCEPSAVKVGTSLKMFIFEKRVNEAVA